MHVDDPFEDLYFGNGAETAKPRALVLASARSLAVERGAPLHAWLSTAWPAWKFDGTALLAVDAIAFNLAAPIVHGAHGRGPAAGGSVLLHMAAPLVGALAGAVGDAASKAM